MSRDWIDDGYGERQLPVLARVYEHRWSGRVLDDRELTGEFIVTWTDGINVWYERWEQPGVALARFAALVTAAQADTFLVHGLDDELPLFEREAQRFLSRTVHASSCQVGCDGTDPENHEVP